MWVIVGRGTPRDYVIVTGEPEAAIGALAGGRRGTESSLSIGDEFSDSIDAILTDR